MQIRYLGRASEPTNPELFILTSMSRFVVDIAVRLELLLYLALHGGVAVAAVGGYEYIAGSFTPQETQNFWSSEAGQNYIFGFKSVGAGDYLLSIWHSGDASQTAIWWADFGDNQSSSTVKERATFSYNTSSAMLQLYDATSTLIWQCCANFSGSSTSLEFLDTGNLRLLQDNSTSVLWESFQDLRDSLMLVGLEGNILRDNPYLLRSRKNQTSYARGRFHMATYNGAAILSQLFGLDALSNQYLYMDGISLTISDGELVRLHASDVAHVSENPTLERVSLDYDGDLRVYRWFANKSAWVQVWDTLVYTDGWLKCRAQSPCGPFGICSVNETGALVCSCPLGYEPISTDNPSRGCSSTRMPHGCGYVGGNDTSVMVQQPQGLHFFYNNIRYFGNISDIDSCKSLCLNECACVTVTHLGSKCFLKANTTLGYLYNGIRTPTGKSISFMKLLQLPAAASESLTDKKGMRIMHTVIIAVAATVGAIVLAVGAGVLVWWARGGSNYSVLCLGKPDNKALDPGLVRFSYHELVEATNNFSTLLGEGGYGKVYKGWLRAKKGQQLLQGSAAASKESGSMEVAIKVLKQGAAKRGEDSQKKKQFEAEVGTLTKLHHVNLVGLLGYCISGRRSGEKRLLVYEYMEKGSLDRYLLPSRMQEALPWSMRFSIALGIARGIAYLHHDCKPRILHFDIKPQNVLLDENFTPKVADFGLAEHFYQRDQSHLTMSGMRGTRGYMAPEWLKSNRITSSAGVYSFGILLLELVHGLNTTGNDHMSLIEWAEQCLTAESLLSDDHIDPTTLRHVATAGAARDEIVTMKVHTHINVDDEVEGAADQVQLEQLRMLRVAL